MNRSMLAKSVLLGASALAIGFGAQTLVVSSATGAENRPYCDDQEDCQNTCETMYPGFDGVAICSSGHTCYCYFARSKAVGVVRH